MFYVYKITTEDNLIYIGYTKFLSRRMTSHKAKLMKDKRFRFDVISGFSCEQDAIEFESKLIQQENSLDPKIGLNRVSNGKISKETYEKMSASQKKRFRNEISPMFGRKMSLETRKKLSDKKKGVVPPCSGHNSIPVKNITTGKEYVSAREASKDTGCPVSSIGRCCKGKQEKSLGYKWKYLTL